MVILPDQCSVRLKGRCWDSPGRETLRILLSTQVEKHSVDVETVQADLKPT